MASRKMDPELYFRASLITAVVLLVFLVFNSLVAIQVAPQLRVIAQFFPKDLREFSTFNTFSELSMKTEDKKVIDEMLARYYVEMYYTQIPDAREMFYRWGAGGPIRLLSLPSLYASFAKGLDKKIEAIRSVQTIKIKAVSIAGAGDQFLVSFTIYNHNPQNGQVKATEKTATLVFVYEPRRIIRGVDFSNPYGFMVVDFYEGNKRT